MDPFLAEIRIFAGNFPPRGWALCDGQLLPISQNTALFALLGAQYGGNAKTTFALPDLQGRAPMHQGQGPGLTDRVVGELSGTPNVTLLQTEMPAHSHQVLCQTTPDAQNSPANNVWSALPGRPTPPPVYTDQVPNANMNPLALSISGGSLPHNNMQPYLCLTFIIAIVGIFPTRQ